MFQFSTSFSGFQFDAIVPSASCRGTLRHFLGNPSTRRYKTELGFFKIRKKRKNKKLSGNSFPGSRFSVTALQLLFNALQRAFFQATHLRLADANLGRHLHLCFARKVPQRHDLALAVRQFADGIAELDGRDPAFLPACIAHLIHHIQRIAAVAVHRLVQRNRLHHALQCQRDGGLRQLDLLGDLTYVRLTAQLFLQLLARLHRLVCHIPHRAAYAHGVVVAQKTADLADDHRLAIGGKAQAQLRIEIIDRLDQPDASHLEQIVRILAAPHKALHHAEHQAQIAADHLLARFFVAGLRFGDQLRFFLFPQHGQLCGVHAADLHLVILQTHRLQATRDAQSMGAECGIQTMRRAGKFLRCYEILSKSPRRRRMMRFSRREM